MSDLTKRRGVDVAETMRNKTAWVALAAYGLVLAPFLIAYVCLRGHGLTGFPSHDSFAYLWDGPFTAYYIYGRSLTQRLLFTVFHRNTNHIFLAQSLLGMITATVMLKALTLRMGTTCKLVVAMLLAAVFASPLFTHLPLFVASEPVHILIVILFVAVLLMVLQYDTVKTWGAVLFVGILTILSKKTLLSSYCFQPTCVCCELPAQERFRHAGCWSSLFY